MHPISLLAVLALFAAPLPAAPQTGGFTPGELVLYNPALKGISSSSGGIARIDPQTGQTTTIVMLPGSAQSLQGSICYDPFRDRLLFVGALPNLGDPLRLWASDAAGNLTDLGLSGVSLSSLTAGAGGRVYARGPTLATPIVYVDAANQLKTLMDAGGTQPFVPPSLDLRGMQYHPGLNALFVATPVFSTWNCGNNHPAIHRVRLSDDGTRALAIDGCTTVVVDPALDGVPVGLSLRPDGKLLVVLDTNSNAQQPRMQLVDPITMAVTPYASNGIYVGAAATNAGTWSHLLNRAVVLDTLNDQLRAFGLGETGDGSVVAPSETISAGGSSGEVATLIEISAQPCSDGVGSYCTAKTSSSGCVPTISTTGCPSASAGTGFSVRAAQVPPNNIGLMIYGTAGPAATSALGGTLCVAAPFTRTPAQFASGAGACGGQYAFDFNAWVPISNDAALVAGAVVHAQFWFRDPPASFGSGLSNAVTFTLAP